MQVSQRCLFAVCFTNLDFIFIFFPKKWPIPAGNVMNNKEHRVADQFDENFFVNKMKQLKPNSSNKWKCWIRAKNSTNIKHQQVGIFFSDGLCMNSVILNL